MNFVFDFADQATGDPAGIKHTEIALNPFYPTNVPQSNGLIFQIGTSNDFIVAFEDGDGYCSQPYGDYDYKDLAL